MSDDILETSPASPDAEFLVQEYWKETVKQADRMDDLAKELFKLEVAIPGLYVTALKLFADKGGRISGYVMWAFICWGLALVVTLWGLIPKRYRVMMDAVERVQEPIFRDGRMTIKQYFSAVAGRKRWFLIVASALFFIGIVLAGFSVLK